MATTDGHVDAPRPDDDVDERFRALMEGLRTSLPGVQVLFAFLLTAPLQSGFADLDRTEELSFAVAFYAAGLASVLLIAPSVHQRLRAPASGLRRQSATHLMIATWVTIVGTIAMGLAIVATTYLVSRLVFGGNVAAVAVALLAAATAWSWAYLPLITFPRTDES